MMMNLDSTFGNFIRVIDYYKNRFRFKNYRKTFSEPALVYLSAEYREEIHSHIQSIRKILNVVDISERKRNNVFKRLNALAVEVDKNTTGLQDFIAIWFDLTHAAGQGAENLEPAIKKIERIGKIFAKARSENEDGILPPPEKRKMIMGPTSARSSTSIDDEIPF